MTASMRCQYEEASCDREAKHRYEWILESCSVEIELFGRRQQLLGLSVSTAKLVECFLGINLQWSNFSRSFELHGNLRANSPEEGGREPTSRSEKIVLLTSGRSAHGRTWL